MNYRDLYNNLVIPVLWSGSQVLSPFDLKVRTGLKERVGLVERVREFRASVGSRRLLLFHCASAGELESLKPLAREFDRGRIAVAVSFFSPSARESALNSHQFEFADYSPIDLRETVADYLRAMQPDAIAITKHDVWPNFVWSARDRGVPIFLINGNFHARSSKLWPLVKEFHRDVYAHFVEIFAVSEEDANRARRVVQGRTPVSVVGDSRFDRVMDRARELRPLPEGLESAGAKRRVIIAGSTHEDDERLLMQSLGTYLQESADRLLIVVPHDPSVKARQRIAALARLNRLCLSDLESPAVTPSAQVLLVNRSGILADLYRAGSIAYVGGGFGKGVHSVLEPMANGLPVICGPRIHVSHEARVAEREGILRVVRGIRETQWQVHAWLSSADELDQRRLQAREFVASRGGASRLVAARLSKVLDEHA